MRKALVLQCFSIRPPRLELGTLGLEIPCSIHLSYGREGGFCVSGGPLLGDLLGAGSGNPILYHGRRGGAADPIERFPARIGCPLRVGPHAEAERGFDRFMPLNFAELGWHDPGRPTLPKGPPEIVGRRVLHLLRIREVYVDSDSGRGTDFGDYPANPR